MSDLKTFAEHATRMARATHRPDCRAPKQPRWIVTPDPACPGCVTDAERAIWQTLADEANAFLAPEEEDTLL